MACIIFHKWDSCKCLKCGTVRDQNHKWAGCKCQVCGKEDHEFIDCKCQKCGKDVSNCYGRFYEYRETKNCANCSVKQRCMDHHHTTHDDLWRKIEQENIAAAKRREEKEYAARKARAYEQEQIKNLASRFEGWSGWLNIGEQNGVHTNYEHFCAFAKRNPPGFPMHIQHAVLDDGAEHVLAILYPNDHEDSSFDGDMAFWDGHDLLRVAEMAARDIEREKMQGGNSIGPYMENYLRTNPKWMSNFGFSHHSFYSGTKRVKEYCKRVTQILASIEV